MGLPNSHVRLIWDGFSGHIRISRSDSPQHNRGMNKLLRILPLLAVLAIGARPAHAETEGGPQSPLRINGFGTFGFTSTHAPDGWYLRRDAAQYPEPRSFALDTDSRLGLQAHYEVNPKLELASQIVLKRRLPGSKPIESVEWLFAAYKPVGEVTIRVGRTNPDLFLLSDYRNVGVAYPWVRPNIELYAGLPLYAMDGADVSYVWNQHDSRWRLKAFAGSVDARATLATSSDQITFKLRSAGGMTLTHEREGLLFRATLCGARMTAAAKPSTYAALGLLRSLEDHADPAVSAKARELDQKWGLDTDTAVFAELGVSYDRDDWIWSAEYSRVGVNTGTRDAQSGYVSLGRRLGDITVFGMVGRTLSSLGVVSAPDWSSLGGLYQTLGQRVSYGINGSRARQSSLSLGARWDFHDQAALKVQWDHFWVSENGGGLWVGPSLGAAQPHVLSATVDFTF